MVAEDETRHFRILCERLEELGVAFGDLPVHEGLWQSAGDTADDLLSRLAIVHMVHEAHGLDVAPRTIARFRSSGDKVSADMVEHTIYPEEITHVTAGMRWFRFLCNHQDIKDPVAHFHSIVRERFHGALKPPFNTEARSAAGFTEEWYLPLAAPKPAPQKQPQQQEEEQQEQQ